METFAPPRELVADPGFTDRRRQRIARIDWPAIDPPIQDLVRGFSRLTCCYTLQSCHGHFLAAGDRPREFTPGAGADPPGTVQYRIAYVALCVARSEAGRALLDGLAAVVSAAPDWIQFGSPTWFWHRQVNTYALQVAPAQRTGRDSMGVSPPEARQLAAARDRFFAALRALVADRDAETESAGSPAPTATREENSRDA